MENRLKVWILWYLLLVISAVVIPFYFLSGVTKVYGAFLFWGAFALAAIMSLGVITAGWRD